MRHYLKVLLVCAGVLSACLVFAAYSLLALEEAGVRLEQLELERLASEARALAAGRDLALESKAMLPVEAFCRSWEPHLRRGLDERELALSLRAGLESLAQRKMGLVTDQATTPEPVRQLVDGKAWRVQRVSLRASGESLAGLLTWLGEAEQLFPYARVEAWELSPAGGSNCSLKVVLGQPVVAVSVAKQGGRP